MLHPASYRPWYEAECVVNAIDGEVQESRPRQGENMLDVNT
jgi:hypothetical protein